MSMGEALKGFREEDGRVLGLRPSAILEPTGVMSVRPPLLIDNNTRPHPILESIRYFITTE